MLRACYLRPVVVRTGEQMGFYPIGVPVETFIIAYNWGAYLGHEALANGVDVSVSSWRRAAPDTFPTLAKAGGNYLNSQLSKAQAKLDGYAEGIMLDSFGFVAEGSGENLFLIRDEVLYHVSRRSGHPSRHHARLGHSDRARSRSRGPGAEHSSRDALYRGRAILLRDGG